MQLIKPRILIGDDHGMIRSGISLLIQMEIGDYVIGEADSCSKVMAQLHKNSVAEFLGSLGLITGLLSRVAAFGISCVMLVAVATVHVGNGFFMNWAGNQKGEGFEYHLLVLGLGLIVMVRGAGAYSVDGLLSAKR